MKAIADLVVRIADLAEAEGRAFVAAVRAEGAALKRATGRIGLAFMFLCVAVPFLLLGVGLLAYGVFLFIEEPVGRPGAAMLTGVLVLLIAGGFVWTFKHLMAR